MARILVADDDPDIASLVEMKMLALGHTAAVVHDGRGALAEVQGGGIDLVVLDVSMPAPTGLDLTRRIRADPLLAAMPVILLSGRAFDHDVEEGYRAGADVYLTKPFSPRELGARVAALLARRPSVVVATCASRPGGRTLGPGGTCRHAGRTGS